MSFVSSVNAFDLKKIEHFSKALNGIVKGYYVKNNLSVDFLIVNESCIDFASGVISKVLKETAHLIGPVTVSTVEESKVDEINLTKSTIIFIEQDWIFGKLLEKLNIINIMKFQHYVIIQKVAETSIDLRVKRVLENDTIRYTNFLYQENNGDFKIFSLLYLHGSKCKSRLQIVSSWSMDE